MDHHLTVAYTGTSFAGWQRQRNALAVQQVLEEALADLAGEPVRTVGAGRTDAGVHARGQAVSVHLSRPWPAGALVHGTNARLPAAVRVLAARQVAAVFDARRCAEAKEYRYHLLRAQVVPPPDAPFCLRVDPGLDVEAIRRATAFLPGHHDFSAFAKSGGAHHQPYRRILSAEWVEAGSRLTFAVVGDGFLRGMVRALVGTLLEVGRGRRSPREVAALLGGGERGQAGANAPARGLVLQRVFYPPPWNGEEEPPPSLW